MRVVHFITRLIIGGAQENTLLTVEDQHQIYGDDVTLITGPGLGAEGTLEPRARAGGFRFEVLPELHRSIRPWSDWRCYRALKRRLRELQPEILHTHSSKAGILGRLAAHSLKLPCVHTIHGASFHVGQSAVAFQLYRQLERWVGPITQRFISVADAMTDQYVAAGVAPRDRFTTISSGFDVDPFLQPSRPRDELRRELGLSDEDVVVGKVARLFHLKGHNHLLAAAPEIVRRCPKVKFLLVGDGELRPQYEAEIEQLGLQSRFVFTGLVPPAAVADLIHAMDLVVHTSEWEGLARVLPQGLIAGRPVVSFDIDGAREVVRPGVTGSLVARGDVAGLTKAVVDLASDADLRRRLGGAGRELFVEQFRHQTMTRRIRDVYADLLNSRSAAR